MSGCEAAQNRFDIDRLLAAVALAGTGPVGVAADACRGLHCASDLRACRRRERQKRVRAENF